MIEKFLPHKRVNSIYDIDLDELSRKGIRGIITDLDNTLVGAKEPTATPELETWFEQLLRSGFQVVIVSNNGLSRVSKFSEPLSLPYIYRAKKPFHRAFRQAIAMMQLPVHSCAIIGDQLMTDVFGGNRFGLHTILVKPISPNDEGFFTRINRKLERIVIMRLKQKGWIDWED